MTAGAECLVQAPAYTLGAMVWNSLSNFSPVFIRPLATLIEIRECVVFTDSVKSVQNS